MENGKVKIDFDTFGKQLAAFVRDRAKHYGSIVAYEENGKLIKEDARTSIMTEIPYRLPTRDGFKPL